jgi:hypothetical protein
MIPKFEILVCSTRVLWVQFGVPPNCGGARGFALSRTRNSPRRVRPVSGGTPETTRRRRVLHQAMEKFRQS